MDRNWFFTWRTYGTWLPGKDGFVGDYLADDGRRVIDHVPGTPASAAIPRLERYAREALRGDPVLLTASHAEVVEQQLHETAHFRGHVIDALAVMTTHVHVVFAVAGDPDPDRTLADWKAYASRALNRVFGKRWAWWAEKGSTRRLTTEPSRCGAVCYVRDQDRPLRVWMSDEAKLLVKDCVTPQPPGEPGA